MNRLPMREAQVNKQLDRISSQIYARGDSAAFRTRLGELNQLKMMLLSQEKEVYQKLGVADINELNARVSSYTGLARLGGANLAASLEKLSLYDDSEEGSLDELMVKILGSKIFQDIVQKHINAHDWGGAQEAITEELARALEAAGKGTFRVAREKSTQKNKTFGLRKMLKNIFIEAGRTNFTSLSKKEFSPEFVKKLQEAFLNAEPADAEMGATARLSLTEENRKKYGGWKYTVDQVRNNPALEQQIREKVLQLCLRIMQGTAEEVNAFQRAFSLMPTASLLAYNTANIQGAIGEVALGAYIDLLTNGRESGLQVGDVRNALNGGGQISIDFLLSHYGFQVKNYNEFAYGIEKSISISRENLLKTWEDKLDLDETLTNMLDIFYGIRWFNIEYEEPYTDTAARIEEMEKNIGDFYARFPDRILRLYEDINGRSAFNAAFLQGRFYNVFYFVSGKRFIPSSQIIQNIINYFQANFGPSSSIQQEVYSTSSYSGFNVEDFLGKDAYKDAPPHTEVAKKVKVRINWRLHIGDLLT